MTRAGRPTSVRGERGVALVMVLLMLGLLLTIVAEFAQAMRLEAVTALNFRSAVSETWLAQAAYQRALAELMPETIDHELDTSGTLVFRRSRIGTITAPQRLDVALDPGRLSYRVTDETARMNVNRLGRDGLDRVLQEFGVEKTERDVIVDSIQDWRDANEEHRLNGAESDYYLGLTPPYRSKNADFDSVDELLQVRGVTRALLYGQGETPGLAEYLTVFGTGAINVNTASPLVLRAALGLAQAEVDVLIGRRPYTDLTALPPGLRRGNQRTTSDTFRIEAWAGGPVPVGRVLTAVVGRQPVGTADSVPRSWRWSDVARTSAGSGTGGSSAERPAAKAGR